MGYSVAGNLWILKQVWAFLIGRLGGGVGGGIWSFKYLHFPFKDMEPIPGLCPSSALSDCVLKLCTLSAPGTKAGVSVD